MLFQIQTQKKPIFLKVSQKMLRNVYAIVDVSSFGSDSTMM